MSNIFQNIKQKGRDLVRDVYFLLDSYNPKKKKGIYTYNWWNDKKDDIWLWRFIKNKFPEKVNRVNLFSCFSRIVKGIKYYKWINIFYTGENLQTNILTNRGSYSDHRLGEVDLALGFEFRKEANYYRFPQWIIHNDFISPEASFDEIKNKINTINKFENRLKPKNQVGGGIYSSCIIP